MKTAENKSAEKEVVERSRLHLRFGWWALLGFLTLGFVLEGLHGFKVGWYLDVSYENRRLMWTLAHAHGTLLALVNVVFGLAVPHLPSWEIRGRMLASRCLIGASLLIPLGFFLGGIVIHSGDPSLAVLLVPPGAMLLIAAIFLTARATHSKT